MSHESTAEPIKIGYLMGAGCLVARRLDPDGKNTHLVARFAED
jgi:hypothetical protein